jgi:tRNA A-37 threonylcarbamoyl transferase component Bud32
MRIEAQMCTSCRSPLPERAAFCPTCGAATPTGIDRATGEIVRPDARELTGEHVQRLQRALGPDYELRHLLGRGGFSEVYAVSDLRLKRNVAVKTFRADLVISETLVTRFRREAEAVAKLRHPHVIPIYAVGEGEGLAYYIMPLLEGESLAAALDRTGAFDVAETCRILREASGALAAAHRAGIVHRDVKPDNIILDGPERSVVVMDFGIAKVAEAGHGLTGTGMLIGTPHYMSPEQATGERDVGPRSDQYSLAMVGYRMLAGRPPFEANSVQALLMKQITEVPRPVHEVRPDVPDEVSQPLSRALSKDPAARFASMTEFAAALGPVGRTAAEPGLTMRRRMPDLATRAREAQSTIARWWMPAIAAGLVGLTVFLLLSDGVTPAPVLTMAANRGDAVYAAKTFLASRGATGRYVDYVDFETRGELFRFLQTTLGTDSAIARATRDGLVWQWVLRRYDGARGQVWKAYVGPRGVVVGFEQLVPDTLPGARLEPETARRLAERELERAGLKLPELRLVQDARQGRAARTDHTFAWERAASSIRWRGADTARHRVTVEVTGNRVSSFHTQMTLPPSFERTSAARIALTVVAWCVIAIAVLAAGVVVSRRGRRESLQWRAALRLTAAVSVLATLFLIAAMVYPEAVPEQVGDSRGGGLTANLIGMVALIGLTGAAILVTLTAAESLAQEYCPAAVAGLGDVADGRLAPEVAASVLAGYASGSVLAGLKVAMMWLGWRFLGQPMPTGEPDAFSLVWPSVSVIGMSWLAVTIVLPLFYGSVLARSWRIPKVASWVIVAAVGCLAVVAEKSPFDTVRVFLTLLVTVLVAWRFGLLAGVLCSFVSFSLPEVWALLSSGSSEFLTAGLTSAALVALPAVFGVLSYRRLRVLPQTTASAATPVR